MNQPVERSVNHDGGQLYVCDRPGISPSIVAMHGFPDDSRIYNQLTGPLAPQRVVTFDWMGYGRSSRRDSANSLPPTANARSWPFSTTWGSIRWCWWAMTREGLKRSTSP